MVRFQIPDQVIPWQAMVRNADNRDGLQIESAMFANLAPHGDMARFNRQSPK